MEELIDLLTQIQDLAGVAIDALTEAGSGGGEGGPAGPSPEDAGMMPPSPEEAPAAA